MTTKQLLKEYVRLRDELAAKGPSERLRTVRSLLNVTRRLYRLVQRYQKAKTKYPIYIEHLETDRALTAKDAGNLTAASAVNKQITEVLREWRCGRAVEVQS